MSDRGARLGNRSILVDLTEESSDGGHHRSCTCSVGQIETVSDTGQLGITHRRRGHGSQLVDERARLANGNEAVTAPVYHKKPGCRFVDSVYGRRRAEDLGMANLRALDDNALKKFHESGALRSGAVLPVVDAVCTNDGIDGCVGVSGKIGLPLRIVGGQSRQGCQVPTSRTSRGDNEIGVPPNWSTLARAHAIAALTSVIWRGQRCCGLVRYCSDRQTQPLLTKWAISACPCNARLPNTHARPE